MVFLQVQVVGLLCRTPQKESRHELLRRVAAGGGAFESENGAKVHLPGANLNDIANQADDLLEVYCQIHICCINYFLLKRATYNIHSYYLLSFSWYFPLFINEVCVYNYGFFNADDGKSACCS